MSFYPHKEPKQVPLIPCIIVTTLGHIILCLLLYVTQYLAKPTAEIKLDKNVIAKVHFGDNKRLFSKKTFTNPNISKAQKKITPIKKQAKPKNLPAKKTVKIAPKKKVVKQDIKKNIIQKNIKKEIKAAPPKNKPIIKAKEKIANKISDKKIETNNIEKKIDPEKTIEPKVIPEEIKSIPVPTVQESPIPDIPEIIDLSLSDVSWKQNLKADIINNINTYFLDGIPEKEIVCLINVTNTGTNIEIDGLNNYAIYAALLKEALLKVQYPACAYGKTLKLTISG